MAEDDYLFTQHYWGATKPGSSEFAENVPAHGEQYWDSPEQKAQAEERWQQATREGWTPWGTYSRNGLLGRQDDMDPSKSLGERLAERRRGYLYGGTEEGRAQAEARALEAGGKYGSRFGRRADEAQFRANEARFRGSAFDSGAYARSMQDAQSVRGVGRDLEMFAERGPGPSAAQAQLQSATNAAMNDQLALARSGRGMGESASALRQAGSNIGRLQADAGNQSAILRAQEESDWRSKQLAAMNAAGGMYGAAAGMDLSLGQYSTDAELRHRDQMDRTAMGYEAMSLDALRGGAEAEQGFQRQAHDVNLGGLHGTMGYEGNILDAWGVKMGGDAQSKAAARAEKAQREAAYLQAGATTAGALLIAASDIREKKNAKPTEAGSAFERLNKYTSGEPERSGFAVYRGGRFPELDDPYGERGAIAFDKESGIYRDMGSTRRPDSSAVPSTVKVGGQDVIKRDVDFGSLDKSAARALEEAPAYEYEYKDPAKFGYEDKTYTGPMAQDLAKTVVGRSAVTEMPDGKLGVDTGRLSLINASAVGEQQAELDQLKSQIDELNAQLVGRESAVKSSGGRVMISDSREKREKAKAEGAAEAFRAMRSAKSPEVTALSDAEERKFQSWAKQNNITDVDHPKSFYDYRGFWKDTAGASVKSGEHFPDTYKQHGHPTFSVESKYSRGPGDGGSWQGETYVPQRPRPAAKWEAQVGEAVIERPGVSGVELGTRYVTPEQRAGVIDALRAADVPVRPGTGFDRHGQLNLRTVEPVQAAPLPVVPPPALNRQEELDELHGEIGALRKMLEKRKPAATASVGGSA